jgi:sugar transferase (PEP-CTERM system associated)
VGVADAVCLDVGAATGSENRVEVDPVGSFQPASTDMTVSADLSAAAETSGGETSGGETSGTETSAAETPADPVAVTEAVAADASVVSTLAIDGLATRAAPVRKWRVPSAIRFLNHQVSVRGLMSRVLETLLLTMTYVWISSTDQQLDPGQWSRGVLYVVTALGALQGFSMYQRNRVPLGALVGRLLVVYLVTGIALFGLATVLPVEQFGRRELAALLGISLSLSVALRLMLPGLSLALLPATRVLVVGNDRFAREVCGMLQTTDPLEGIELRGLYDTRVGRYAGWGTAPTRDARLADIVAEENIGEIVVAAAEQRGLPLGDLLALKLQGILVTDYVSFLERERRYLAIDAMRPSWLLFGGGFAHGPTRLLAKRLFDVVVSVALLTLLLPFLLIGILAIYLESGRPIFFRQDRVGVNGRIFPIFKLRSMVTDAETDGVPKWARQNDSRVTRVGRLLRKTRVDEIPQLIGIVMGDMSFVGPRPEREYFVRQLREQIPHYDLRHTIKPGLSGWAQVSYPYGASIEDARAKLRYDLYYIKNHSLLLDVLILLATVRIVVFGSGAR